MSVDVRTRADCCSANTSLHVQPENILFRTKNMDSDIMIADFGLSKLVNDTSLLSTACGTPNYVGMDVDRKRTAVQRKLE